jgi:hypothetical protein
VPCAVSRMAPTVPTGTPFSSTVKFWYSPDAFGKSVVSTVGLRSGLPRRLTTPYPTRTALITKKAMRLAMSRLLIISSHLPTSGHR